MTTSTLVMEYLHPKTISKEDSAMVDEYKQMRIRIETYKKRYARKEPRESQPVETLNEMIHFVTYESTNQARFESICALERDIIDDDDDDIGDILLVVITD